jgi:Protein of unknown function with PCYCGC motif
MLNGRSVILPCSVLLALSLLSACRSSTPGDATDQKSQPAADVMSPAPAPMRPVPSSSGLPPLPAGVNNAVRPPEVVRAVYEFAARHPEVLEYMPCFCGCERGGHNSNADCFIAQRDAKGRVAAWETHATGCEICIDVAQQAMQMHNSGASVAAIRAAIEKKFAGVGGGHTPTPMPSHNHGG